MGYIWQMTYPFEQATHYSVGRGIYKPRLIVIHTMQTPETIGRAKQVWKWFAGKTAPKASAHYCVDAHDIVQSVKDSDTAWAVGNSKLNQESISIELSGMANQTAKEWADIYSKKELALAAKLCAELAKKYKIPAVKLTPAQINAGKSGFCGHVDITVAKAIKGGHTDPGANFPWANFISLIKENA